MRKHWNTSMSSWNVAGYYEMIRWGEKEGKRQWQVSEDLPDIQESRY